MTEAEKPLSAWGAGERRSSATLQGETVLKTAGHWSQAVIGLLQHLERVGFDGAPRVVGSGFAHDGRLAITFVPGASAHPGAWTDDACFAVGALLRRAHEATASFEVPPGTRWAASWIREVGQHDDIIIGHGDAAPWNIVGPNASPATLIDWDLAGPVDRLTEVAYAVWLNAQLHDDDIASMQGLPLADERMRQARSIVEGYELDRAQRARLVNRMIDVALAGVRADAIEHEIAPDSTDAVSPSGYPVLWSVTWRARSAGWMFRNRRLLSDVLSR